MLVVMQRCPHFGKLEGDWESSYCFCLSFIFWNYFKIKVKIVLFKKIIIMVTNDPMESDSQQNKKTICVV